MRIVVLGAGVIGVTTAWYLRKRGHEVMVVERRAGAGLETSFANGAQISVGQAEPWANPAVVFDLAKWLGREDAPLRFRARADMAQWLWSLRFLRECTPARVKRNVTQLVNLARASLRALQALRDELSLQYGHTGGGILAFHTERRQFEVATETTALMRELGCDRTMLTAAECRALEPALARLGDTLIGGAYTRADEAGDASLFTRALADAAAAAGVEFRYDTVIERLHASGEAITGVTVVDVRGERSVLTADRYVAALGSYTPLLIRPLGLSIPVYPVKGYSVTVPLPEATGWRVSSLTDNERKLVYTRLGGTLRVAGTAELDGYNTSIDTRRCDAMLDRAQELFPQIADRAQAIFWAGLRPATPGNVPLIGHTRYRNLYLNTGHGTLGWTLACGSGRALADLIDGDPPEVEFEFLRGAR